MPVLHRAVIAMHRAVIAMHRAVIAMHRAVIAMHRAVGQHLLPALVPEGICSQPAAAGGG